MTESARPTGDRPVGASFLVLGLGEAVARVIAFAGTIYVARTTGAESYGIIAVASAIVLYFSQVANFSVEMLGARELARLMVGTAGPAHGTRQQQAVAHLVPSLLMARLLLAALCVLVLVSFALLALPRRDGAVLAISAMTLFSIAGSSRFAFVGLERPAPAAVASVIGELLTLVLVLQFVRSANDLNVAALTRTLGDAVPVVLMLLWLRARGFRLRWRLDLTVVRPVFAAALPLVINAILGLAIYNSDLIFLRVLRDARTAGMYAAAYALISFLLNLGVTYGTSILPTLARDRAEPGGERRVASYQLAMLQVLVVALPVAVGGAVLAAGLIELVFGSDYLEAIRPMQILLWTIVPAFVRNVAQMGLIAYDRQTFVLRATAWSAAANLVLNLLLIPRWGMTGAAAATLITEAMRAIVNASYASGLGITFGIWRELWRPLLAAAGMGAVLPWVRAPHVLLAVLAGMVVYGAILVATGGLRFRHGRLEFRA